MSVHCYMSILYEQILFLTICCLPYITSPLGRVFANGPGNLGSILGQVIPKTFKMVLDTSLLNTQQYKMSIKGKEEQSRKKSSALLYTSVY